MPNHPNRSRVTHPARNPKPEQVRAVRAGQPDTGDGLVPFYSAMLRMAKNSKVAVFGK